MKERTHPDGIGVRKAWDKECRLAVWDGDSAEATCLRDTEKVMEVALLPKDLLVISIVAALLVSTLYEDDRPCATLHFQQSGYPRLTCSGAGIWQDTGSGNPTFKCIPCHELKNTGTIFLVHGARNLGGFAALRVKCFTAHVYGRPSRLHAGIVFRHHPSDGKFSTSSILNQFVLARHRTQDRSLADLHREESTRFRHTW